MTPSSSLALKFVNHPTRAAAFLLKFVWAAVVLVAICLLWLVLFVLVVPFLLLSQLIGWKREDVEYGEQLGEVQPGATLANENSSDGFVFDRRKDISKLFGCNTRNVQYRWSIFARRLVEIQKKFPEPVALDFGAGSLRDSYELSRQGFTVVSVDLNEKVLKEYFESYDWTTVPSTPQIFAGSLEKLSQHVGQRRFQLALSFDVIEHLEDPGDYLKHLRPLLDENGYLFTAIPNRRTVMERYFRHNLGKQRRKNIPLQPGVPHLQFRSPQEWVGFLEVNGFTVVDHQMAIGFLVNDIWNGLLGLPIYIYVTPVLQVIRGKLGLPFDPAVFERVVAPAWLMSRMDVLDNRIKKWFSNQFAWNLIVAQKMVSQGTLGDDSKT